MICTSNRPPVDLVELIGGPKDGCRLVMGREADRVFISPAHNVHHAPHLSALPKGVQVVGMYYRAGVAAEATYYAF